MRANKKTKARFNKKKSLLFLRNKSKAILVKKIN